MISLGARVVCLLDVDLEYAARLNLRVPALDNNCFRMKLLPFSVQLARLETGRN